MNKEETLKKISIYLKVLIVFAVINTILLLVAVGEPGSTTNLSSDDSTESSTSGDYDVSMFDAISGDDFINLLSGDGSGTSIIYLGREGCSFCLEFLPVLQQAQNDLGYTTKYLDITTVDEEDANTIMGINDFLETNYGSTPLVVIAKDGKYVDGMVGYVDYDEFVNFLNDNNVEQKLLFITTFSLEGRLYGKAIEY